MALGFKKTLVINLAVMAVLVLLLVFLIAQTASDINKKTGALQEARNQTVGRLQIAEAVATLKKEGEEAEEQLAYLESRLPIQEQLIEFTNDVNNLAKKRELDMGFVFGQEVAGEETKPSYLSFTITARGTLANWLNFLKDLEGNRHFISFDSINLAGDEKSVQSLIKGKVFYQ